MSDKNESHERSEVVEIICDPTVCLNADKVGDKHVWDGDCVDIGPYHSVSCSRCGVLAIDVDQWAAP
jgi:hypothetical protein